MRNISRNIPNIISIIRIALSVVLLGLISTPYAFIVVYVLIGISDVLDGFLARNFGWDSQLGAQLDSIADVVFYSILMYVFYRQHTWAIVMGSRYIVAILIIRLLNMLLTKLKYKRVVLLHTIGNKASGFIVFLMPMMLMITKNSIIIKGLLSFIILAAFEELCITLLIKEPKLNRRSIFIE